jgi:hypothetical protein
VTVSQELKSWRIEGAGGLHPGCQEVTAAKWSSKQKRLVARDSSLKILDTG